MRDYVYFISTLRLRPISSFCDSYYQHLLKVRKDPKAIEHDIRTWGFVLTFKEAEHCVLTNNMDIHEYNMEWACIEKVHYGFLPAFTNLEQHFYRWVGGEKGKYVKMKNWPKKLEKYYKEQHLVKMITTIG